MVMTKKSGVGRKGQGGSKWSCDACGSDVTSTVRIHCNVCKDVDLCVPCFARGETGDNKEHEPQFHAFRVIEQHSVPIFAEDWGADEELSLITGAEIYGLGSWQDIADHVGGFRTKDEVRDHYIDTYVKSSKFPLPERAALDDTRLSDSIPREEFQARKKRRIEERRLALENEPLVEAKQKPIASQPSCHEVQGFMPGRLEFETEWFNEAEEAVQHMSFEPGDGRNPHTGELEPEMELKLKVVEIYNSRLTQRIERKKILFEHELLEFRRNQAIDKKRSKEEKELHNKCKPFARLMTRDDFLDFTDGILEEGNLRTAIKQLQEWRSVHIDTLAQGEKYEQEKQKRIQASIPSGSFDRLNAAQRLALNKGSAQSDPPTMASQLVAPELPPKYQPERYSSPGSQSPKQQAQTNGVNGTATTNGTATATTTNGVLTPQSNNANAQQHVKSDISILPIPNTVPLDLNDENAADRHLLSEYELKLCSILRIYPKPYMKIKQHVLNEATKAGGVLKKKAVKEMIGLEGAKGNRIFEFFAQNGWIGKA